MYLVVRESLGMSIGKTAAQCAHASQMLQLEYDSGSGEDISRVFQEWLQSSFRKVVLKADDKEWEKVKAECPNHVVVRDAGLTEIAAGSETVIGIWPMRRSERPKILTKLQVLK